MRKILVIDDSVVIHAMIRQSLAPIGDCQFSFARNGREALDHLAAQGSPELIVLDVNMPVMDGFEFLGELSALQLAPHVPVVVVTTEGRPDDVERGRAAGVAGYVTKPFTPSVLRKTVEQLLASHGAQEGAAAVTPKSVPQPPPAAR